MYNLQLTCLSCFQWATEKEVELWQLQREVLSASSRGRTTNAEGYQKLWYERSWISTGKRRQTLSDLRGGCIFLITHATLKAFLVCRNNTDAERSNFSSFIFHLYLKDYFLSATLLAFENLWGLGFNFLRGLREFSTRPSIIRWWIFYNFSVGPLSYIFLSRKRNMHGTHRKSLLTKKFQFRG